MGDGGLYDLRSGSSICQLSLAPTGVVTIWS